MSKNRFNRRDMLKVSGGTLLAGIGISQTAQANTTAVSPGEEITGTIESAGDRDEFELLVDQGDVIEVEFEKGTRNQTALGVNVPSRQIDAIDLGGEESVGEETYRSRYTIIQTGTLNISVGTYDSTVDEPQEYAFTVTRYDGLDEFPATERAEISAGNEISGTIHSENDADRFELPVSQGDVIEVEFEKGTRNQTALGVNVPSRQIDAIDLGGEESVGEETYRSRYTIIQTGTLEVGVGTFDSDNPAENEVVNDQSYAFTVTRYDGLDEFPATERAEISAGNEISGTIHSENDTDRFALPVSQGDVIEVEFEKGTRNQTALGVNVPSRQIDAIDLGGEESVGEETYRSRYTIIQTGTLGVGVATSDSDNPVDNEVVNDQSYAFTVTRYDGLDEFPATERAEISAGNEISGTIHSENDVDRFELPVSQGDVIEVEFEKGARNQTGLGIGIPSRQTPAIELGGSGSEGQEQFEGTVTIEQTGTIGIGVSTSDTGSPVDDDVVERQDWRFIINGTLSVDTGEVTGTVTTDNGDSLGRVTLEFVNPNTESVEATAVTSEDGTYSVELAADQTYEVVIEEEGYEPVNTEVTVEPETTQTVNIELIAENGSELPDIDVTGDGNAATDTDGDGRLDDINGDGESDIFDVQALYRNVEDSAVQNNPEQFDFDGSGDNSIDIFDVQALYNQL